MIKTWESHVLQGWDAVNTAINALSSKDKLAHANNALSLFEDAHQAVGEDSPFEAFIGMVHAYCYLADLEIKIAASRDHARAAVACAEYLLRLWLDQNPIITVTEELLRIKDAFGCALRQRYIYLGDQNDCLRAIELHSACVKYEFPSNELKASWNYNLSLALITLIRNDWTTKRMLQIFLAFTSGYKALQLSNWSNPLHLITLCSFRIFIVLETKHHSIDWAKRNALPDGPTTTAPPDVAAFLHMVGIAGGQGWLSTANSLNRIPYVATIIDLVTHITHLLDDNASTFTRHAESIHHMLFEQQYEFDLRHTPFLIDVLGALVRCRRLGLLYGNLTTELGKLLIDNLLGPTQINSRTRIKVNPTLYYYELPRLLYLIGESHYLGVSELKVRGHRDLDYLPAIIYQRAALELTLDGHPRQFLYLLSLAFALAGSSQNTDVQNDDDLEEFILWIKLIIISQMESGEGIVRDISRGDEYEKIDLLASSLPLETDPAIVEWVIKNCCKIFNQATPGSEQHRVTGVTFASFSMRWSMAIVRSNSNVYTEKSYDHVKQASKMWKLLISHYPGVSDITFGYGAALSIKADHKYFLKGDVEGACVTYGTSIDYMHQSLGTSSPSTILDIQQRQLLADTHVKRHRHNVALNWDTQDDIKQAIVLSQASIQASIRENMPATMTHSVAKDWSKWAVEFQHPSVLEAYQAQIGAFMQLAWVGFEFSNQVKTLQSAGQTLAADASTCAIAAGRPELAIEMHEACRTVLLLSAASARNAPSDLRKSHPELVSKLEKLGRNIREMSEANNTNPGDFLVSNDRKNNLAQQLRQLGIQWDRVVSEVRGIEGCEDFMRMIPFDRLAGSLSNRITVSVVTSEQYDCCHALLLIWGEPYVLRLPLTPKKASRIFAQFKAVLKFRFGRGYSRDINRDDENGVEKIRMKRYKELNFDISSEMSEVLRDLWNLVMQHVIDFIKAKIGQQVSILPREVQQILIDFEYLQAESPLHIWVNATGHLSSLPLHAAGLYHTDGKPIDGQSVLDHVICSYNPSLSSLRLKLDSRITSPEVLALGAGENLNHVKDEVKKISEIFTGKGTVTTLVGEEFHLNSVKTLLPNLQIAHFASHGVQDANNPLNSRLLFHSQSELTLEELMKLNVPKARLAVLFACETAQGTRHFVY